MSLEQFFKTYWSIIVSVVVLIGSFYTMKIQTDLNKEAIQELKEDHISELQERDDKIEELEKLFQAANIELLGYKINEIKINQDRILNEIEEIKEAL